MNTGLLSPLLATQTSTYKGFFYLGDGILCDASDYSMSSPAKASELLVHICLWHSSDTSSKKQSYRAHHYPDGCGWHFGITVCRGNIQDKSITLEMWLTIQCSYQLVVNLESKYCGYVMEYASTSCRKTDFLPWYSEVHQMRRLTTSSSKRAWSNHLTPLQ